MKYKRLPELEESKEFLDVLKEPIIKKIPWTEEEHKKFLYALALYGKNWSKITRYVGTRARMQVTAHGLYLRKKWKKDPT